MAWSDNRAGAIALLNSYTQSHAMRAGQQLADQLSASPDLRLEQIGRMIQAEPYNLALRAQQARLQYETGHYSEALSTIEFIHEHQKDRNDSIESSSSRRAKNAKRKSQSSMSVCGPSKRRDRWHRRRNPTKSSTWPRPIPLSKNIVPPKRLYERYLRLRPDDTNARIAYARVLNWDQRYAPAEREYSAFWPAIPTAPISASNARRCCPTRSYWPAISEFALLTDTSKTPRADLYPDVAPRAYFHLGQIYRWFGWNDTSAVEQQRPLRSIPATCRPGRSSISSAISVRPRISAGRTATRTIRAISRCAVSISPRRSGPRRDGVEPRIGRHEFTRSLDQDVFANAISGGANYRASDRMLFRGRHRGEFLRPRPRHAPVLAASAWSGCRRLQSRAAFDFNHYDLVYDVFNLSR